MNPNLMRQQTQFLKHAIRKNPLNDETLRYLNATTKYDDPITLFFERKLYRERFFSKES